MRVNGTLSYLIEQTASFDEDGVPTPNVSTWSQPVECWIQTNTHNERGTYQDGKFTQASYLVLLERQRLATEPSRVRLVRGTKELGEYDVQDCQRVHLDRIKIIV